MRRALLLVVGLLGCGDDGGATIDGPPPDSDPACGAWTVAPGLAQNLRLYDPAPIAWGRTVRVAYDAMLDRCEQPAMPGLTLEIGGAQATVTARVLRQVSGTCADAPRTVVRIAAFQPSSPGEWTVALENTTETITLTVGAEPNPACNQSRSPCEADCDCDTATGERCVGTTIGPAVTTACERPCEVDRDCGGTGRCTGDVPGGTPFVCDAQPECDATRACPTGFTCASGACTPTFELGGTTRHECLCDAECDAGLRCARPYDTSEPSRCQALCPTDGPWCAGPGAHVCGDLDDDLSGLSGTDASCGFLGD